MLEPVPPNPLPPDSVPPDSGPLDTSLALLQRAQAGDSEALNALATRYLPRLRRWTTRRLPGWARDLSETDDLVQESLMATLRALDRFKPEFEGALQAYLRTAVANRVRMEIRRVGSTPAAEQLTDDLHQSTPSPFELAVGREAFDRYEAALATLKPDEREAVIARLEMDLSYKAIAIELGKPSAEAARKMVERALARLADRMNQPR
jgi:RNA polymerase sigma-70 factor (ECF subfamily)